MLINMRMFSLNYVPCIVDDEVLLHNFFVLNM